MAVRKKMWRTLAKEWFTALVVGTPAFHEKEPEKHDPAPVEHKINKDIVQGGTQTAGKGMFRVAPHHRIIAGMGSGGPEDVNTYALAGDRKYNMRDHTRLIRGGQVVTSDQTEEAAKTGAVGSGVADIFEKQYDWSNGKPVPLPQKRVPVWVVDHVEDIVVGDDGVPRKSGFVVTRCHDGGCEWSAVKVTE